MINTQTRRIAETSLFAALIFLAVSVLKIPVPGGQFVHVGNALVVVGVLLFGSKRGALSATIGLGVFDVLNGYASVVWITVLESLLVCLFLHLFYERLLNRNDKLGNIIASGVVAAVTKIILNIFKYTVTGIIVAELPVSAALMASLVKITGTFGSALVTIVAVPLLYPIFKKLLSKQ
ncbi:ECF transporter S component [Streptococcus ovis]|uniref:ECF transporter S component n=1 Tax=Streptococcus ovis TaxID=82806 RepID=UPI0003732B6C|nr:ECF transporter S component [Streptococcus ovis]